LAVRLQELERFDEARRAVLEAIGLWRGLETEAPGAFRVELASSLNTHAAISRQRRATAPAVASSRKAVTLFSTLAAAMPRAIGLNLAVAQVNLAAAVAEAGQADKALPILDDVVCRLRSSGAGQSGAPAVLAEALLNLSQIHGQREEAKPALAAAVEACDLLRELGSHNPIRHRPVLAQALATLLSAFLRSGRLQEALDAGREAVDIWRPLAAADPARFGPELAFALNNMAAMMDETGASVDAVPVLLNAIKLLAPHFSAKPDAYRAAMCGMLKNYTERIEELGVEPDGGVVRPILDILVSRTAAAPGSSPAVTMTEGCISANGARNGC
jgi:hypothetical protein